MGIYVFLSEKLLPIYMFLSHLIVYYCLKKWISASMSNIFQYTKSLWLALSKLILWNSLAMFFPFCKFFMIFFPLF